MLPDRLALMSDDEADDIAKAEPVKKSAANEAAETDKVTDHAEEQETEVDDATLQTVLSWCPSLYPALDAADRTEPNRTKPLVTLGSAPHIVFCHYANHYRILASIP